MNLITFILVIWELIQLCYVQAELHIAIENMEIINVDPNYFKDIEIRKLENNAFFVNYTLIQSLPIATKVTLALLGDSSGEYIVRTGIDVVMDLCESVVEPIFGRHLHNSLGMGTECPTAPGVYGNKQLTMVDTDKLPDQFPQNKYKMEVVYANDGHSFCQFNTYFEVL